LVGRICLTPSYARIWRRLVKEKPVTLEKAAQAVASFERRQNSAEVYAEIEQSFMSMKHKGFQGLGAWDRDERVRVNDLLGFKAHIVFPTTAFDQVQGAKDPEIFAGSVQALNRGLASFCETDARMHPAAYIPFRHGPETAMEYLDAAIAMNFSVVMIDTIAPQGSRAFTHPDFDPIWAKIQDADIAITIHVGTDGGWDPVPLSFYNNGGSVPEHSEGDAPRDAIAYMGIQYNAELFLAAMIFDGVFHRFPKLRVAVVELGASWVVSWMKHMDQAYRAFRRLAGFIASANAAFRVRVQTHQGHTVCRRRCGLVAQLWCGGSPAVCFGLPASRRHR
jgi:hypothetical protein